MSKKAAILASSFLALSLCPGLAHAGFEFVPPVQKENAPAAADAPAMPPVEAMAPVAVQAAPVTPVQIAPDAMPTPVASALKDLPVRPDMPNATAPVPVVVTPSSTPVVTTPSENVVVARPQTESVQQDRMHAVYPPPGNAAAAPLARNGVAVSGLKIPVAAPAQAAPVAITAPKDDIVWNQSVPSIPASVVTDQPVSPPVPPVADPVPASNVQNTNPQASFATIDGFGDTIPLAVALDQIVPKDYQVTYKDKPDPATMVSWSGGRPWNDVLMDMLYAHGYRAVVTDRTVTIMKAGKLSSAQPMPSDMQNIAPAAGSAAPDALATPASAPVAQPVSTSAQSTTAKGFEAGKTQIFSAHAGESLQDVLSRWSDQSKAQLYWTADRNYVLKDAVAFNTTYLQAVGRLLDGFAAEPNRPVAKFHPNQPNGPAVLAIENSKAPAAKI